MSSSQPTNVLFIMSDQQQGKAMGCAGHDFVRTPNLDKLAARGTRFANAYTNSAICVPARAVMATGQHVFRTGYWCNAHPYDGRVKSWHHLLGENGRRVAFCEYYAAAADRAAFMVRRGRYKYIHYVGYEPELFDLSADPEELENLAAQAGFATVVEEYEAILRSIVDPEAADDAAYVAQTALVEANGGRDALIARGKYDGTPAPGQPAVFDH